MKHKIPLTLVALISLLMTFDTFDIGALSINLKYDRNQFVTETLPDGTMRILTPEFRSFPVNYGDPALPWIYMTVEIPVETDFSDLRLSSSERQTMLEDVTLETLQYPVTTDVTEEELRSLEPVKYKRGPVYPTENVRYVTTREYDGKKEVCILVSPLSLNSADGTLWVNTTMDIELTTRVARLTPDARNSRHAAISTVSRQKILSGIRYDLEANNKDKQLDYLIITADSLADSFEPLLRWKRKKGLNADLLTLSAIYDAFASENSPQLKIKRCIQMLKEDYGLKYVLLGGDGNVVPCQYCYGIVKNTLKGTLMDNEIPTDLYYSTFKGDFEWNKNGNELFGEANDNIVYSPEIAVSRLPFHTIDEVDNYIVKLLKYETNGNLNSWSNTILFSGADLKQTPEEQSSEPSLMSNKIFDNYIKPYWNGTAEIIFSNASDTSSNFKGIVTSSILTNELTKNNILVDINCHGFAKLWQLDVDDFEFTHTQNIINNDNFHPIVSNSCFTNTYGYHNTKKAIVHDDDIRVYDLSLAEGFLKSATSGVISYLGNTRQGLSAVMGVLGVSEMFNSTIYKTLFSSKFVRLSQCLNDARSFFSQEADVREDYRWIMYSLNLSGDPETEIYTIKPRMFNNITVCTDSQGRLEIKYVPSDSKVKIGYVNSYGQYQYSDPHVNHPISLPSNIVMSDLKDNIVSLSLTNNKYLPLNIIYSKYAYWKDGITFVQNFRSSGGGEFYGKTIKIGSAVCDDITEGNVVLQGGNTIVKGESITFYPGFEVEKGAELTVVPIKIN